MSTPDLEDTQPNRYLEEGNTEAILGLAVRVRALEESQAYGNRMVEDMRKEIITLNATCRRIEASFAVYEPYLKDALSNDAYYKKIRDEVITGVAKSAVWATIAGLGVALFFAIRAYIRSVANGEF